MYDISIQVLNISKVAATPHSSRGYGQTCNIQQYDIYTHVLDISKVAANETNGFTKLESLNLKA